MRSLREVYPLVVLGLAVVLTACGGGGGNAFGITVAGERTGGGIAGDGSCAVGAATTDGSDPNMAVLLRRGSGFSLASPNGHYRRVSFGGQAISGISSSSGGRMEFDGSGGFATSPYFRNTDGLGITSVGFRDPAGTYAVAADTLEIVEYEGWVVRLLRQGADLTPGGPEALAGLWCAEGARARLRLTFRPDGTMEETRTSRSRPDENTLVLGGEGGIRYLRIGGAAHATGEPTIVGTWELEDGILDARLPGGEALRFEIRAPTSERLVLVEPSGDVSVLTRRGTPMCGVFGTRPMPRTQGTDAARLRGEWLLRNATREIRLTFCSDGTRWEVIRTAEGTGESQGRYEIEHGTGFRLERRR